MVVYILQPFGRCMWLVVYMYYRDVVHDGYSDGYSAMGPVSDEVASAGRDKKRIQNGSKQP